MALGGVGTVVGRGIILIQPHLPPNFGNNLNGQLNRQLNGINGNMGRQGRSIGRSLGGGIAAGIGAIGVAVAASVNKAAAFEKQLSAIKAVSGATGQEMDLLRRKALQLGADSKYSASEAALAMEELVKAGVSVPDVLNGAADATIALAAAGEVELPRAAEIASNAMNSFGLSAQQLPHVADQIAGAANASAISVDEYAMSMAAASAVAKLAGVSFEDTTTAIALLGNAGIKGSDAGTSLKTMFQRLTPSTKQAREEMMRLGIITADGSNRFYDAQGNAKSLSEISGILQESLAGLTAEQKQQALQTLFGSDAIRGAAILSEQGAAGFDRMAASIGKVKAADVAKERMNNLSGAMEQLKGTIETLAIQAGTFLLPALTGLARGADAVLGEVPRVASGLAGLFTLVAKGDYQGSLYRTLGLEEDSLAVGAILRVREAVLGLFSLITLGDYKGALQRSLGLEEDSPIVRGVLFLRDVVGAGIRDLVDSVRQLVSPIVETARAFGPLFSALAPLKPLLLLALSPLLMLIGMFRLGAWVINNLLVPAIRFTLGYLRVFAAVASWVWGTLLVPILRVFGAVVTWLFGTIIRPYFGLVMMVFRLLGTVASWVFGTIILPALRLFGTVVGFLWGLVGPAFGLIAGAFRLLGTVLGFVWNTIIKPIFTAFWTIAKYVAYIIIAVVVAPIVLAWWALSNAIRFVWETVLRPVWNAIAAVARWLWHNVLGPIFGWIRDNWSRIMLAMKIVWETYLRPAWNAIASAARALWDNVLSPVFGAIGRGWGALMDGMGWVWRNVLSPVFDAVKAGVGFVRDAFGSAIDGIRSVWDKLSEIFRVPVRIVITIVDKFDSAVNWILDKVGLGKPLPTKGNGLPELRSGGVIPGPHAGPGNRDNVLGVTGRGQPIARVEPEEFIVNRKAAAKHAGLLHAINSGADLPAYGLGGWVKKLGSAVTPDFVGSAIKGVGDAAQWAYEGASGLLRAGAANAVDATYRTISGPLFGLMPKGLIPDFTRKTVDSVAANVIEWIRGKEVIEDVGVVEGLSAPLIVEYLRSKGIRGGHVTTTGGGHSPGSYHYKGMAADFGDAAWPNQRGIFDVFAAVAGSLLELYWTPAGRHVRRGQWIGGGFPDHSDHVHVAATVDAMNRLLGRSTGPAGETRAGSRGAYQSYARSRMAAYGLNPGSFGLLDAIWSQESGWNPNAVNRNGGAYGIPQIYPPAWGHPVALGDWRGQINWGLNYIRQRYGSMERAYAFKRRHGTYDTGGILPDNGVGINTSGAPERVLTARQNEAFEALVAMAASGRGLGGSMFGDVYLQDRADLDLLISKARNALVPAGFGDGSP